ncbi:MAG TPA: cytochrome P450 [Mycobacterium sp.]|nr:cytochrome P450 [Mycobacterium sp.]
MAVDELIDLVRIEEPSFYENPVPIYQRLQQEAPVFYYAPLDLFILTKHEDIRFAAQRKDIFSPTGGLLLTEIMHSADKPLREEFFDPAGEVFSYTDSPRHRQLRRLLTPAFTPRALATMTAELEESCRGLVNTIDADRPVDFVEAVASRLPILFASRLLGTTSADVTSIRRWSDALENIGSGTLSVDELHEAAREFKEMNEFFLSEFDRKRQHPGSDLTSTLLEATLDGEKLSEARLITYCTMVLAVGTDTTRSLLTGMAIALARHPDQLARLRADRSLMPTAVDEALRWTTPGRGFVRTLLTDTEIRGEKIKAGQRVYLFYAAGNIDPDVFPDPLTFDITRDQDIQHLGFGFGPHICLAAQLVRMETAMIYNMLLDRFSTWELAAEPRRLTHILRNGWHDASLVFTPAPSDAVATANMATSGS